MIHTRMSSQAQEPLFAELLPDLTPLVDVMFMLLVFFLLTANTVPLSLTMDLPSEDSHSLTPLQENQLSTLKLYADGSWEIDGIRLEKEEALRDALQKQFPTTSTNHRLILAGDKSVTLDTMLHTLVILKEENIEAADFLIAPAQRRAE